MSNVINDIKSAPQTFSSWDACMSKAYCKWPAIVGIVIASLIVLSIVWCIASCLCCGATLCGSCVSCLTCCGCCGMCKTGSGGGKRKSKHKDDYRQMPPTPYNGYQPPPAPMSYDRAPTQPQFAHFDASSKNAKFNEDALPAMPTWADATTRRVEDHSEPPAGYGGDVEMGRMAPAAVTARGGYRQLPVNGPRSPISPGFQPGYFEGQPQQHPYQSDLSTQPMHDDMMDYDNGFAPAPMSPAPTYTTQPPAQLVGAVAANDQFARHAPTPQEYNRQQHQRHQKYDQQYDHTYEQHHLQRRMSPQQYGVVSNSRSPPYSPTISTRYEASDYNSYHPRSTSPPSDQYGQQHYRPNSLDQPDRGNRPPSLLQVGRKPVQTTHRDL